MNLKTIAEALHLTVKSGGDRLGTEVTGGYVGDLLSDVMGNSREGDIWITRQVHQNIVAVASLKEIAGIILVKGASMEGDLPLVIWKWPRRPAPAASDVILGFTTSDVYELVARVPAAGGRIIQSPKDDPEHGVRVGFVADVDGRLIEVVQMLAA